jgi:hypothetical protein
MANWLELRDEVTITAVAREALGMATDKIGTAYQRRISAALKNLGWERGEKDWQGRIAWRRRSTTEHGAPRSTSL